MTLAAVGFFALKFLIFFVLMVFCVCVGTAIAVSLVFYCEQHFDNMWLEISATLVPTILWCVFSVWLIVEVIGKLSNLN